jgi:putative hemolysin
LDESSRIWAVWTLLMTALLTVVWIASAEAALSTISRARVRAMVEKGSAGAAATLALLEDFPHLKDGFGVLKLGVVAWLTGAAFLLAPLYGWAIWVVLPVVLIGAFLLQSLSWAIGTRLYVRVALLFAPVLLIVLSLLAPLMAFRETLTGRVADSPDIENEEEKREEEEQAIVIASVVGDEDAEIEQVERDMIYNIVTLNQTTVREVMVPRPDLVVLRRDSTIRDALDVIISAGHSRIPVYETSVDNIIGVLYAKDLLKYLRDEGAHSKLIENLWRTPIYVPASKMADELLEELQNHHVHMAIVLDEYGGTAGLVTIEDILEEIVGEIRDEYDAEEEPFRRLNEYEAEVSGRFDIDDLNEEMDLELPTADNDTVGGLILSALGRVAQVGDVVRLEAQGVTFTVKQMIGRRIGLVRLEVDRPDSDDSASPVFVDTANSDEPAQDSNRSERGLASAFRFFVALLPT